MSDFDPFRRLAQDVMNRSKRMEERADRGVQRAFSTIASSVVRHNPLWSGQSRLNWKAAVSYTVPTKRFVNVARTNVKKNQGGFGTIEFDASIAATATAVAVAAIREVTRSYRNPKAPSNALPRATDVVQRLSATKPPSLYLSNSINYIEKLWSGSWHSNPRTLANEIEVGKRALERWRLLE